jgi:hypothetical protein
MSDFHDWEGVLGTPGFRAALLAYGRANGEIKSKLPNTGSGRYFDCAETKSEV